jgi:hypothetical protein
MSYIILRGHWYNIIVLNVHAPTEDEIDDMKDRFYEELEQIFDKFPRYNLKILLGRFQCQSRQGRYFQAKYWEREFT